MKKILIVEDNEMNRDMLSRRLSRKGYEIDMAEDGEAGLTAMRDGKPDIVLMDMGLPVKDGWTATAEAKGDEALKNIPIIADSAESFGAKYKKKFSSKKPISLNFSRLKMLNCSKILKIKFHTNLSCMHLYLS